MILLPEVEEFFSGVRGRECWSIIGGAGTGSVIDLEFGEKVKCKRPLRNPKLSLEERLFQGERALIIYCDWRIEGAGGILCTSQSTNESGSLYFDVLLDLKDSTVANIGFTSQLHDLRVEFDNGIALSVFCDLPVVDDEDSNYVMFNPTTTIAATARGSLTVENR